MVESYVKIFIKPYHERTKKCTNFYSLENYSKTIGQLTEQQ